MRATFASIFELPLDKVPTFGMRGWDPETQRFLPPEGENAWVQIYKWLDGFGIGTETLANSPECTRAPYGICCASGPSPRAIPEHYFTHMVVYDADFWDESTQQFGKIIHDPTPNGGGLAKIDHFTCFYIKDPSKLKNLAVLQLET